MLKLRHSRITSLLLLKLRHSRVPRVNTRVDLGLRDPFRVCAWAQGYGTIHARGLFSGSLSGSPRGVHALRDEICATFSRVARGYDAPRGTRVTSAEQYTRVG